MNSTKSSEALHSDLGSDSGDSGFGGDSDLGVNQF